MRCSQYLALAVLAVTALAGGSAFAANVCQADKLTCPTTMPVDGYCQCKAHGMTADGTVVAKPVAHRTINATSGAAARIRRRPAATDELERDRIMSGHSRHG